MCMFVTDMFPHTCICLKIARKASERPGGLLAGKSQFWMERQKVFLEYGRMSRCEPRRLQSDHLGLILDRFGDQNWSFALNFA